VIVGSIGITNESLTLNGPGKPGSWGALDVENGTNIWAGPITMNANSTLDSYYSGSALRIAGTISGSGGLELFGSGTHFYEGTNANTYTGVTTVDAGTTLLLNKPSPDVYAVPTNMIIAGTVRLLNDDQIAASADVTIQNTGQLFLNTHYCYMDALSGAGTLDLGSQWLAVGIIL
jgi:hypothetical protein